MINYEYFDSVDNTEENKKHAYTINDYSDTIEKSHITINREIGRASCRERV